jgi:hypothetical protein
MIYDIANRTREVRRTGNNYHDQWRKKIEERKLERTVQSIISIDSYNKTGWDKWNRIEKTTLFDKDT